MRDIEESINRIISCTRKIEYEDFRQDNKTQDTVIRNREIMGEAVKVLSDKVEKR